MSTTPQRRRNFLSAAFASLAACLFAKETSASPTDDNVVKRHMRRGDPPTQPLDTMLLFERGDDNNDRAMTHEVLSLIHQEKGKNSYPWTLYTSLETHHENGDACVHCARLHKYGPGWSSGLHSEVFNHARAVALGVNIEMSNDYTGGDATNVIGLNIQAVGGPTPMQYAIHIHDKDAAGAHFETGIGVTGTGKVGIDLAGHYETGIHARGNNIRLGDGACIELDDKGEIKIRYRDGKIEFLKNERRIPFLDTAAADHAI
ncbi:MAG: hypothetical protein QOF78_149 [Phycisphaerales bacterium]|jgi:hypothetical protein|nr:hypothetical protein [Phycisphaerales bacterium]